MKSFAIASLCAATAFSRAMVGTNIGGWQVLEPWITPSLFYRFLGKTQSDGVGMDQYTFCEALGPEEGNAVLREHWDNWITEDTFQQMADREVEMIRLPIGDWALKPYGPYVGCTDGAADKITWALDMGEKYGIQVLLDVHAVKGSQNGYDNSGLSNYTTWSDENNFDHWSHALGEWMGDYDEVKENCKYTHYNWENIAFAVDTIQGILDQWGDHPALAAIEPVNEPWWCSDMGILKAFYKDVRNLMREQQPRLIFVFHDAFHFSADDWNDLFDDDDHENVVMDTHQYFAWWGANDDIGSYCDGYGGTFNEAAKIKYDIWVGEWSLATDVCALWLGGFNDANTDAAFTCQRVDCPYTYMPTLGTDFDRTADSLGPYGATGLTRDHSIIKNGTCAKDSDYFPDDQVMRLGQCSLDIFNWAVQGHFMWTVRNELEERWNYIDSYDKGWIKNQDTNVEIEE